MLRLARAVRAHLVVVERPSVLVTPPPLLTESNVRAVWTIMLETGRAQWPPQPAAPVTPCACPAPRTPLPSQESSWSQKSPKTRKHVRSRAAELWARAQLGRWNRIQKTAEEQVVRGSWRSLTSIRNSLSWKYFNDLPLCEQRFWSQYAYRRKKAGVTKVQEPETGKWKSTSLPDKMLLAALVDQLAADETPEKPSNPCKRKWMSERNYAVVGKQFMDAMYESLKDKPRRCSKGSAYELRRIGSQARLMMMVGSSSSSDGVL